MKTSNLKFPLIYIVNTKNFTNKEINILYNLSDKYIQDKYNRLISNQDKINCLCGNVLRKYLIFKNFGIEFEKQELTFNNFNKPYLKKYNNIYFNISHSENLVACIISNKEIGIDIQKITKYNDSVAKYIFNEKEYRKINNSHNKDLTFTKLWTKMESILKLQGKGFTFYKNSDKTKIKTIQTIIDNYVLSYSIYKI